MDNMIKYMDEIRREWDRAQVIAAMENAGFACYDHESTEDLIEQLAAHCIQERVTPEDCRA
jgi:hypothetical protein